MQTCATWFTAIIMAQPDADSCIKNNHGMKLLPDFDESIRKEPGGA